MVDQKRKNRRQAMKHTQSQTVRVATLAALAIAVWTLPASAATFDVTTTADGNDGACDAHCTLREAIVAANLDRDRDLINLPAGTYRLSISGRGEDRAATGDLDILERIDLRGSAEQTTIIDGEGIDRVLHVHVMEWQEGDEAVEITDVTVTGGEVRGGDEGGGILVAGALVLEHSTVQANSARGYQAGGGGIANKGVLVLKNVTVSDNSTDGDDGPGGGIWNHFGTLTIDHSVISDNSTDGDGGDGAGLWSEFGVVTMNRVSVSGNTGAGAYSDGGGIWAGFSTFVLKGSTVSDNSTAGVAGGGGIWMGTSTVVMANCTISGNVATGGGGGIWTDDSTLTVTNCTISGNSVTNGWVLSGAIWKAGGTVVVTNTLIDGDCFLEFDLQSGGGNLESPGNSCGFNRASDRPGVSAEALGLGSLADNGGPTPTHALLAESAAIDSGLDSFCPAVDQRGEPRPRDGDGDGDAVCDIGAFEAGTEPGGGSTPPYSYWIPVAAHVGGANGSVWRTTVGALNRSSSPAELEFVLRTSDETFAMSASVAGYGQGVFPDVAGQLGVTADKGTLEIRSDRPLFVTSRTFNQSADGTYGQYLAGMTSDQGLRRGETGSLPQLVQSAAYRCNLGLANMGSATATAAVSLYDAGGFEIGALSVTLEPGELHQENEVYSKVAGRTDIDGGYAKVRVTAGSGVVAYGSVIDNGTGDATTIPMWR
jgi:CSLREA domain-containing protein